MVYCLKLGKLFYIFRKRILSITPIDWPYGTFSYFISPPRPPPSPWSYCSLENERSRVHSPLCFELYACKIFISPSVLNHRFF